jgi:hypothetical protein
MCSKSQYRPGSVNTSTFSPVAFAGETALTSSRGKQMAGIVPPPSAGASISRAKGSTHPRMPSSGADFYCYLDIRRRTPGRRPPPNSHDSHQRTRRRDNVDRQCNHPRRVSGGCQTGPGVNGDRRRSPSASRDARIWAAADAADPPRVPISRHIEIVLMVRKT